MNGKIIQIIGPVVDVEFESNLPASEAGLPAIYTALIIKSPDKERSNLVLEVAGHLGNNRVRAIAMGPTEGLPRGENVINTGRQRIIGSNVQSFGRTDR